MTSFAILQKKKARPAAGKDTTDTSPTKIDVTTMRFAVVGTVHSQKAEKVCKRANMSITNTFTNKKEACKHLIYERGHFHFNVTKVITFSPT